MALKKPKIIVKVTVMRVSDIAYDFQYDYNPEQALDPHLVRAEAAVKVILNDMGSKFNIGETHSFDVDVSDEPLPPPDHQDAFRDAGLLLDDNTDTPQPL